MGINKAAKYFNIPKTTLLRRIKNSNETSDRLGPDSCLGKETEHKLVIHIKKLQKSGFAPTRREVRQMAYSLAKKMGITHKFNNEEGKNIHSLNLLFNFFFLRNGWL